MRILIIKTSSLGDVLNTLPAVSDARRAWPDLEIDWAVEEAFAPAPSWHPGVSKVIPVNLRRWRSRLAPREIVVFLRQLRERRYDLIVDAQGLMKSALLALAARGPTCGFDTRSAREGIAALLYDRRANASWDFHAVDRQRQLFAQALAYPLPQTPPDFGLRRRPLGTRKPSLILLHGTTWATKRWPESHWIALARLAVAGGIEPRLRWQDAGERESAERIAASAPGTKVLHAPDLESLRGIIEEASVAASNDSGPAHLAAALGIPSVTLYGATRAEHNGTLGSGQVHLTAEFTCSPCRSRTCSYRGPSAVRPACYASLPPQRVWREIARLLSDTDPAFPENS
jgi:heptosyltransferase I